MAILVAILSMIGPLISLLMALFAQKKPLPGRSQRHLEALLNKFETLKTLCAAQGIMAASNEQTAEIMASDVPHS